MLVFVSSSPSLRAVGLSGERLSCCPYPCSCYQVELNEIESSNEEYPETRAFLALLGTLTELPLPANIGAGYRAPGFDPYLTFVRDSVFLKFDSRSYRNPSEKVSALSVLSVEELLNIICWSFALHLPPSGGL